jgi:hypothetical protein
MSLLPADRLLLFLEFALNILSSFFCVLPVVCHQQLNNRRRSIREVHFQHHWHLKLRKKIADRVWFMRVKQGRKVW